MRLFRVSDSYDVQSGVEADVREMVKWWMFLGCFERWLRKGFFHWGLLVGRHPVVFLLLPLLLTILLLAYPAASVLNGTFMEEDRVWWIYSPINAKSHEEHAIADEFFRDEGEKFLLQVGIMAKDGGSLLRDGYLEEVSKLLQYLEYNMTVNYKGRDYSYADVCDRHCGENEIFDVFRKSFRSNKTRNNPNLRLTYPMFDLYGQKFYIGHMFLGVEPDPITRRFKFVQVINFQFRSVKRNQVRSKILEKWEMKVFDLLPEYNVLDTLVNISALSDGLVSVEVRANGLYCTAFFMPSCFLIFVFVIGTSLRKDPIRTKPWEGVGGVVGPVLAIISAFGVVLACNLPFMALQLVAPFLILAIGVDDCFILLHAWHKSDPRASVPHRLAETLSEAGPSITMTSLTNAFSFGVGALSPTPGITYFCLYTAVAVIFDFIYQITFFAAILTFGGRREEKGYNGYLLCVLHKSRKISAFPSKTKQPLTVTRSFNFDRRITTRFLVTWSKIVTRPITKIIVFLLVTFYWAVSGLGCYNMRVDMDPTKVILDHSRLQPMFRIHVEYNLKEGCEINVFINDPPDLTNETQRNRFLNMVGELEAFPRSMGANSTALWLRPYIEHLDFFQSTDFYQYLPTWLNSREGERWQNYIKLNMTVEEGAARGHDLSAQPNVDRFMFTSGYKDSQTMENRAEGLIFWRELSEKYSDFNMTIFEFYSFYVDQHISLLGVTVTTVLLAIVVMFIICLLFIPSIASVLCATAALLSINVGVFGLLSWWDVNLDPVSMATTLMAIGFSIDFTCHISYHFYKADGNSPESRLTEAFKGIGWPMLQAGVSTLAGVMVLFAVPSYMATTFSKTVFLVVFLGLLHGLVILPVVLTSIPDLFRNLPATTESTRTLRVIPETIQPSSASSPCFNAGPPSEGSTADSPTPLHSEGWLAQKSTQIQKLILSKKFSMPIMPRTGSSIGNKDHDRWPPIEEYGSEKNRPILIAVGHPNLAATKSL